MNRSSRHRIFGPQFSVLAVVVITCCVLSAHARPTPLGTAFTYQGQLKQSGANVNSTADFQFTLWDALSGRTQVAGPVAVNNVSLTNGLFTVPIDFGSNIFDGNARWLQIAVRSPAGSGSFFTLSPRQPLTATPYALQTRGIFVDASNNVGIGTTATPNRLTVDGGASFSGNVTLGTNSPLTRLMITDNEHVDGTIFTGGVADAGLLISNNYVPGAFTPGLFWHTIDNQPNKPKAGIFLEENANGTSMHLGTSGDYSVGITNDGIVIGPNGFVGIGTNVPEGTLHVLRGFAGPSVTAFPLSSLVLESSTHNYLNMLAPAGSENGILFGHPFDTPFAGSIIYNNAGTPGGMQFRTGGNVTRMVIDEIGRVSIGDSAAVSSSSVLRVDALQSSSYKVAIEGIATGDTTFDVGVAGFSTLFTGTGIGVRGRSNSPAGYDFYASGAGQDYGTGSSIRWKHNIVPISDPLERVEQIRGVFFDWDQEHGGRHAVGMIAEEVGKVLPEVVVYEANGIDANGMDYGKTTPLLVEAVKALRAEKDQQIERARSEAHDEIAALHEENSQLRTRLETLEKTVARLLRAP